MTENAFAPPAPDPTATPAVTDHETAAGNKRLLVIGGSVLAVVALGFGGFLLLGGSGGSDTTALPVTPGVRHLPPTSPVTKVATPGTKADVVPVVSRQRIGKDPFMALYLVPAAAPAAASATASTTTSSTTSTTTHTLQLSRVYGTGSDQTAVFVLDKKTTQLAKVGTVFGPTAEIKLLSLSKNSKGVWTASAQVGDGQPFDVSVGQSVSVL